MKDRYKFELPPANLYNPQKEKVLPCAPATSLGYGERNHIMSKSFNAPGPGSYKTFTRVGNEGPKYVMGSKLEDTSVIKKAKEIPAPD